MDKQYKQRELEDKIYQQWEDGRYFTPQIDRNKKPFTILLPPPNANAPLHVGHAMYVIEDILCRYHRMCGEPTLFLPGTDHAGIETQYVFEKELAKKGKSRFDYDRGTLYRMIDAYVEKNRGIATTQMRKLGFSLDWSRERYTLEPTILAIVYDTFRKLHADGLIYRDERLVNYCTYCGTAFSNLEIDHVERQDQLYYLDYSSITIATARPETIFADVAVAVHPQDQRYLKQVGKTARIPLINREIPIIADAAVKQEFGTGALKITPGHDPVDYEIGQRHHLPRLTIINRTGRMVNLPQQYLNLTVKKARAKAVQELQQTGKLLKEELLLHAVAICYRCKRVLEPILSPQWYLKIKPLVKKVERAVAQREVQFFPRRFKKELLRWLATAPDWNISRQIVWGPRIPAWYCLKCNPMIEISFLDEHRKIVSGKTEQLLSEYKFTQIKKGLQSLIAPVAAIYQLANSSCQTCDGKYLLQETDTFDTWFSSGQWPFTTLGFTPSDAKPKKKNKKQKTSDFDYFYPTSVLDTMWDILPFWVMRMLLLGIYRTGKVPFAWVHLHSRVVDAKGQKMSKSKGNVVNPIAMVEQYGTDAVRLALVYGVAPASDVPIGEEKLRGMRNFANKLWNIGRFIEMKNSKFQILPRSGIPLSGTDSKQYQISNIKYQNISFKTEDRAILTALQELIESTTYCLDTFRFSDAALALYDFTWNRLANEYMEQIKERLRAGDKAALQTLVYTYETCLKLLHPFIPFVTEAIWHNLFPEEQPLIIALWPGKRQNLTI